MTDSNPDPLSDLNDGPELTDPTNNDDPEFFGSDTPQHDFFTSKSQSDDTTHVGSDDRTSQPSNDADQDTPEDTPDSSTSTVLSLFSSHLPAQPDDIDDEYTPSLSYRLVHALSKLSGWVFYSIMNFATILLAIAIAATIVFGSAILVIVLPLATIDMWLSLGNFERLNTLTSQQKLVVTLVFAVAEVIALYLTVEHDKKFG